MNNIKRQVFAHKVVVKCNLLTVCRVIVLTVALVVLLAVSDLCLSLWDAAFSVQLLLAAHSRLRRLRERDNLWDQGSGMRAYVVLCEYCENLSINTSDFSCRVLLSMITC